MWEIEFKINPFSWRNNKSFWESSFTRKIKLCYRVCLKSTDNENIVISCLVKDICQLLHGQDILHEKNIRRFCVIEHFDCKTEIPLFIKVSVTIIVTIQMKQESLINCMPYVLSCLTCFVLWCLMCFFPYVVSCFAFVAPYVLFCPTCSHASCTSCFTCSTVNHYDMQLLLMECYYSGFFLSDKNLQDPLIYLNPYFINSSTCIN